MHRVTDYRDQAARYRRIAGGIGPEGVRRMYLGWAADLERRADVIEAEEMAKAAATAQGIEARSGETPLRLDPKDESPVAKRCAQPSTPSIPRNSP